MQVGDYVLQYLADLGVKKVFLVYGSAIGDIVDAFTRTARLEYVCVMHEQAGAFAAETLTKVDGSIGVCLVTSGPGGTNLVTGIANAWYDSIPNIYLTGQVQRMLIRKDPAIRQLGFQENDIVSMVKPITKFAATVMDPKQIKWVLDKAVYEATHGRPGPVLIDLPADLQKEDVDPSSLVGYVGDDPMPEYLQGLDQVIDTYLDRLNQAERPVLLGGGGIHLSGAVEAAQEVGRVLKIPCIPTWNALDIFSSDYPFYRGRVGTYGGPGRNFAVQNADLLLTLGCRISGRITGGVPHTFARAAYKVIVDVDKANLTPDFQEVKGDVNIYCDAKVFAKRLIERAKARKLKDFGPWLDRTLEWRDTYDATRMESAETSGIVNPYTFMRVLSEQLGPRDVVVADCGGNVVLTNQAFRTKTGQRLVSSNGNSPMGYAFAGAIGACFADARGKVVSIIGDGGFNVNIQELATVKNYNLPLKTFILNNHVYGITKAYQDTNFGGRYEASGPIGYAPPDFLKIAEAYGIHGVCITDHEDLAAQIQAVLEHEGPVVCDVNIHEWITYEPRIFGWSTPIEDMYPYLSREEFLSNLYIPPAPGWDNPVYPQKASQRAME